MFIKISSRIYIFSYFIIFIFFINNIVLSNETINQRAVWVTRWDYKSPEDVKAIMKNAHYLGANQVFFQIRGNGTVFYNSEIEPWAWELTGDSVSSLGQNPGWDPLAKAVSEAGSKHLEVHGWINVFPGWRGRDNPPSHANQLWMKNRSWFMLDHEGVLLKPPEKFYTFLSPGNPEVRQYLAKLFGEIAAKYPNLSGLHMDYVRYPANRELRTYRNFSFDTASVKAFKEIHNRFPSHSSAEWAKFKCDQVTKTVRGIRKAIKNVAPTMQLSASCIPERAKALDEAGQESEVWLDEKIVDWIVPMAYRDDLNDFRMLLQELIHRFGEHRKPQLVIGLNADSNSRWGITKQIEEVQSKGWGGEALFAYSSLFSNHKPNSKAEAIRKIWLEEQMKEVLQRAMAQ